MRINQQKIIKERMVVTNEEYEMIWKVAQMFDKVANNAEDSELASDAMEVVDCINYMKNEWIEIDD